MRQWSATNAMAWDVARARPSLVAKAADDSSLGGLDAKMTLREYDRGRLRTDWVPKRGRYRSTIGYAALFAPISPLACAHERRP